MVLPTLSLIASCSIALGILCALYLAFKLYQHPPHMRVMAWVWPLSALFGHVFIVWFYHRYGHAHHHHQHSTRPNWVQVAKGTLHCGSGCTLGDLLAETAIFWLPGIAVALGWHHLFAEKIFASWILDFILALVVGILFQYFALKPMRSSGRIDTLKAALKADILSLSAWQIGMYGFMALAHFYLFAIWLQRPLPVDSAIFWLMMQLAMVCGFITAYPVNYRLIKAGVKEAM